MAKKYACCKHGPDHLLRMPRCGFAHRLTEVQLPDRINSRMWYDLTHMRPGPAGIDFFLGQDLTAEQLDRICSLVTNEGLDHAPVWCRLLFWFRGHGYPGDYCLDSDFGWQETVFEEHCQHFNQMYDDSGRNIVVRLRQRMASAVALPVFRCRCSWTDNCQEYADSTPMFWGPQSKQYLALQEGSMYCLVGEEHHQYPWWYVVPRDCINLVLTHGGWVPPVYLESMDDRITVHEMPLPVCELQQELFTGIVPPPPPPVLSDEYAVYCDGSCNARLGIAAGWSFQKLYFADRASLSGTFQGSEASELLGIVGALAYILSLRITFIDLTVCTDSQRAYDHVFECQEPSSIAGRKLYPAIRLARALISNLRGKGIHLKYQKNPREVNFAHGIAKDAQRRRFNTDWLSGDNVWPGYMDIAWQDVFRNVAHNQEYGYRLF